LSKINQSSKKSSKATTNIAAYFHKITAKYL